MSDRPTGIETNGIGKRTTAHLNLTRSMARDPEVKKWGAREEIRRELRLPERGDGKVPFAGREW